MSTRHAIAVDLGRRRLRALYGVAEGGAAAGADLTILVNDAEQVAAAAAGHGRECGQSLVEHGLHHQTFVRPPQLQLRLPRCADVFQDTGKETVAVGEFRFANRDNQGKRRSVSAHTEYFSTRADHASSSCRPVVAQVFIVVLGELFRHQHFDVVSQYLAACVAEHLLAGGVERFDETVLVDGDDAVNRRSQDGLQALFVFSRCV